MKAFLLILCHLLFFNLTEGQTKVNATYLRTEANEYWENLGGDIGEAICKKKLSISRSMAGK